MTELRILSGGAAHGLVAAMQSAFSVATGFSIDGVYSAVGGLKARVVSGEQADVVILTAAIVADLERQGLVVACSSRAVGNVETAVAVRRGSAVPSVSSADGLRSTFRAATGIYYPDPEHATAGIHFTNVLRRLGIFDETAARHRIFPNGATAMKALAEVTEGTPIGCTQATEIVSTPGVTLVAKLPGDFGLSTTYTAGLLANATHVSAARWLIDALAAPENAGTRKACGFE